MIRVQQWTGREAVLLQSVLRLSNRDYARELGVSFGTVMNWRRERERIVPQPPTQQILDAALRTRCTPEELEAFTAEYAALTGAGVVPPARIPEGGPYGAPPAVQGPFQVVSHKFLPTYLGALVHDLWDTAAPLPAGPAGLERRTLPLDHPDAAHAQLYLYRCGVAMAHIEQHQQPDNITDLAVWRYRTYLTDRPRVGGQLAALLDMRGNQDEDDAAFAPGYVLSVYELGDHPWNTATLPTAMQLLATPSVLVDRQDPDNIHGLDGTEQQLFESAWEHPDAVEFSGAVSMGLAGWSGIAYHPLPAERALTTAAIVDLELDVQALWALSTHVQDLLQTGQDPVMPEGFGRTYLAAAYSRLTQSGPVETVQHRLMRKAILATSELPERLRAAQDALRP